MHHLPQINKNTNKQRPQDPNKQRTKDPRTRKPRTQAHRKNPKTPITAKNMFPEINKYSPEINKNQHSNNSSIIIATII
jgi:hypothetical protein